MQFKDFQEQARLTDQAPSNASHDDAREPARHEIIPLLGLVGEVGGLLGEYKKRLRDGKIHRNFRSEVAEELGDILWYVANVADKFDLDLEQVVSKNLQKVHDRWRPPPPERRLYDGELLPMQRLPRQFEYRFVERIVDGEPTVTLLQGPDREIAGNELTDNAYVDDGYRFHDVMHLAFATRLAWSPVLRKLLRDAHLLENRPPPLDDAEDGGRGQVVEEAIVAAAYTYASEHQFLQGIETVDWRLLRHIKEMTRAFEVADRSTWEWNDVLLLGFSVWRDLHSARGGSVSGDLETGVLELKV